MAGTSRQAEEWRARAEELQGAEDALLFSECVLRTRLHHFWVDSREKRESFGLLAARFRRYFELLYAQGDADGLREAFEEAVEDWGRLCEEGEGAPGTEESAEQRASRLAENARVARLLFANLDPSIAATLRAHLSSPDFDAFLREEFGNAQVLRCLEGRAEMEGVRRAVEEEERLNPLMSDLRAVLVDVLGGEALTASAESELAKLAEAAKADQDYTALLARLEALKLPGVERPAQPDLPSWREALARASTPEAACLLQLLPAAEPPTFPSP